MSEPKRWAVVGVPIDTVGSPDGGPTFGTEASPGALRALNLVTRLGARDLGDLDVRVTGRQRDPVSGIVGWPSVGAMTTEVRHAVRRVLGEGERPLLLGGCCGLVMGAVAGARDELGRVGVVTVDGHVDAYDHRTSPTGEAADMPVAALLGLGWPDLLRLMGTEPVVAQGDAVVIGARDPDEAADIGDLPERLGIMQQDRDTVVADPSAVGRAAVAHFASGTATAPAYWVHLDVDVLDEGVFPATDYLMPNGLDLEQLGDVLRPIVQHPAMIGFSLGCYNPSKDPDGRYGVQLADLLVDVLGSGDLSSPLAQARDE
ncbi:MAG: arginase family protein [Actinomycetales bacterium]